MIHLEKVTPDNWRCGLAVREDQRKFVADSACILARAYAYREQGSAAFIIFNDGTPVGMALYYGEPDPDYREYVFSQFFIDSRYQGKGYGFEAAKLVLDLMRAEGRFDRIVLCYVEGDDAAKNLYEKLGFRHTGEVCDGEVIMEYDLK